MSRHDKLNIRESLGEAVDDNTLPLWMKMQIDLINENNTRCKKSSIGSVRIASSIRTVILDASSIIGRREDMISVPVLHSSSQVTIGSHTIGRISCSVAQSVTLHTNAIISLS